MPRLTEILVRSRDSLSDPLAERWTDNRLVRLADDAQKIICEYTGILRAQVYVAINLSQRNYVLPPTTYEVLRVVDNITQTVIPLLSFEQADLKYGKLWENHTGTRIQAILYNKQQRNSFTTYPIVTSFPAKTAALVQTSPFGVVTGVPGIVTTAPMPSFGTITAITTAGITVTAPFGVTSAVIPNSVPSLSVYCTIEPSPVAVPTDLLTIDAIYDRAIKFYIVGNALLDDLDTQHRTVGKDQLRFFQQELQKIANLSAHDFVAGVTSEYQLAYNGGI